MRRAELSRFSLGTINFEMFVRLQVEMLSRWSDRASSARGVARQEMKMWELSARGWYSSSGDWMKSPKEPGERGEKAMCMLPFVIRLGKKITIGFGKMEAIGDFAKNSFSGAMEG